MLNNVIQDISGSDSYSKSQMFLQIQKLHENYTKDLEYMGTVEKLINELSGSSMSELEKDVNHKKKQQDIQEYYHQKYQQQIFIVKLLILFALVALVGCVFFNYGFISVYLLTVYLGLVFSVGFVVIFYYLWDLSIRDNSIFDEYDFQTYLPPKTHGTQDKSWNLDDLTDNNILC